MGEKACRQPEEEGKEFHQRVGGRTPGPAADALQDSFREELLKSLAVKTAWTGQVCAIPVQIKYELFLWQALCHHEDLPDLRMPGPCCDKYRTGE